MLMRIYRNFVLCVCWFADDPLNHVYSGISREVATITPAGNRAMPMSDVYVRKLLKSTDLKACVRVVFVVWMAA